MHDHAAEISAELNNAPGEMSHDDILKAAEELQLLSGVMALAARNNNDCSALILRSLEICVMLSRNINAEHTITHHDEPEAPVEAPPAVEGPAKPRNPFAVIDKDKVEIAKPFVMMHMPEGFEPVDTFGHLHEACEYVDDHPEMVVVKAHWHSGKYSFCYQTGVQEEVAEES